MPKPTVDSRWYTVPDMGWKRALCVAALLFVGILAFQWSPLQRELQDRLARPIEFRVRHWWGKDPAIDKRLVIYSLGDRDRERFRDLEPSLAEWGEVLEGLAKTKPRAILIPKVFAAPGDPEEGRRFAEKVQHLSVPVLALGFAAPTPIALREAMDRERPEFDPKAIAADGAPGASISWVSGKNLIPYGPHPNVRGAFHVGHLQYDPPLFPLGLGLTDGKVMALAPLLIAQERRWAGGHLWLDGKPVGTIDGKLVLPNLPNPNQFRRWSLGSLLSDLRKGIPLEEIKEPDTVILLLPSFYTGNSDMLPSPMGLVPGGLLTAAMVNSVLTGEWIAGPGFGWLGVVLAVVAGLALGKYAVGWRFWTGLAVACPSLVFARLAQFSWGSIEYPWLLELLTFGSVALGVFLDKQRRAERRISRLRETLEGFVEPKRLEQLLQRPSSLSLEPSTRLVSVMFIDIVGFSTLVDQMEPKEAFLHLKEVLSDLTMIIHAHEGTIDKTLGDGLLAFFGYSYTGIEPEGNHADASLNCAIAIQRHVLDRNIQSQLAGKPLFPLRIGINSTSVYIGDLGNNDRIDLTIIGDGVNFAKRLESACESGRVLVSPSTRDLLANPSLRRFYPKHIQIKHHDALFEAFECDPNEDRPDLVRTEAQAYRKKLYADRREPRWQVPSTVNLRAVSSQGEGRVVNFSLSGMAVEWNRYLGRGSTLSFALEAVPGVTPTSLVCDVRWGRPSKEGLFLLGLEIRNLNLHERHELSDKLRQQLPYKPQTAA